ncbi:unnamed protein product [Echinostoma caproni]|uniref:Hexosyltransferase n=1 Tax=Echinostoma caproni TaxID=27848 RepID=A0A183ARR0_9TREM|nr:unnamed protein product [Echinostoma caproni]
MIHWGNLRITLQCCAICAVFSQLLVMSLHFFILAPNTSQTPYPKITPVHSDIQVDTFIPEKFDDVVRYKNARWEALNTLNGYIFRKDKKLNCEMPVTISKFNRRLIADRHPFIGTAYFNFPRHVDLPGKLCQFKQGYSIGKHSITDRNFHPLVLLPLLCGNGTANTLDLLILIKSAGIHTHRRMAIRKLWGDKRCWGGRIVRHVFLLGVSNQSVTWMPKVREEIQIFRDIIQQDFVDHYYNNTYKMLFGLQWAVAFCPEAKWLMFVDDDFFVNPRLTLAFIDTLDMRLQTRLVVGDLAVKAGVLRERSKWSVNKTLFPYNNYPNFVQAGAFFMGAPMALDLYVGSRFTEFFPFDDVFIGLVLNKLLIAPAHIQGLFMYRPNFRQRFLLNGSIALHGIRSMARQKWLWHLAQLQDMCHY